MAKTGRILDMVELSGTSARRRPRGRIRGWFGMVAAAAIAVTTGVFVVTGALSLVTDQQRQESYDSAPYCTDLTNQTDGCVTRTTARVGFVDVSKNTGKNAHGYTTTAWLDPQAGQSQIVVLSGSRDLSGSVRDDDTMAVLVWNDQITRFTFQGQTHDTDENPHHIVASHLAQVAMCLLAALLFGRVLIRRLLRFRIAINLQRNRIPDWTLVALGLSTGIAALLRASYAVTALGLAGMTVLVLSVVWPFIPWVATQPVTQRLFTTAQARRRLPAPGR